MKYIYQGLKIRIKAISWVVLLTAICFIFPTYFTCANPRIYMQKANGQQEKKISGHVQDENGAPIVGASVREIGVTDNGTITDANGDFELTVSDTAVISISSIGYVQKKVDTRGKGYFNITIHQNVTELQNIVVTAFAKQKKINLTGAISTISGNEITSKPVANISNALIGLVPGVNGLQTTGEPGRNQTDIKIRGIATYGNSNPLVVIDGVEQPAKQAFAELNSMDPNEIASVSILKDASSTAVYGIRAANGVIIITTKRGQIGKPKISFSANYGMTQATMLQKGLSSYEWASMRNEAIKHDMNSYEGTDGLSALLFSDKDLWKLKHDRDFTPEEVAAMSQLTADQKAKLNASPAIYYGSQDSYKQIFGKYGPQTQLNLSVSGGTENVQYFTSFGFLDQEGITNAVKYYNADNRSRFRRYNFRSNFDINVIKNLTISLNIAGQFSKMQGPGSSSDPYDFGSRYFAMMQLVMEGNPIQSNGIVNGHLVQTLAGAEGGPQNPLAVIMNDQKGGQSAMYDFMIAGEGYLYNNLVDNTLKLKYDLPAIKGLSFQGTVNYQDSYNKFVSIKPSLPIYTLERDLDNPNILQFFGGSTGSTAFNSYGYSTWNKFYVDAGIRYENSFKKNNLMVLALGKASKYTMPNDNFHTPSGIMGLVGRLTYNYANKYMAEVNLGYNGTEQFAEGQRFSLFPAFSAGWIPTLEPFFPKNDYVSFLKIRGSFGEVGNDMLGNTGRRYLYLPNSYNLNTSGYYLGTSDGTTSNSYYPGAAEGTLGNPNITWEKARKLDFGLESIFLNNRLTINYDWFSQKRNNILTTIGIIPGIYGVSSSQAPPSNIGKTENKGYEILVSWKDKINKVGYYIEGHLTYAKNKILYKAEAPNPYDWMNETGKSIGQHFGLHSDGLYNTLKELNNRPYNSYTSNKASLGDVRYIDINGDGLIDNKDVAPIGYPSYPEYSFGIKLRLEYQGFSLSALLNGSRNGSFYLPTGLVMPYVLGAGNAWQWMYDGRWTPEKAASGKKATYPRPMYNSSESDNDFLDSDFWIRSTDFLRLKNIEVAYTFNSQDRFIKRMGLNSLRIYANGNNIYTFKNDLTKIGIDPEQTDQGQSKYIFPLIKTFNFGFQLQF